MDFELRRDAHAIGEFAAITVFKQPVSQGLFTEIVNALSTAARSHLNLPAPINMSIVEIEVINGAAKQKPGAGIGFQRFASDGEIEAAVLVDPASITIQINKYQSWEASRQFISTILDLLIVLYSKEIPAIRALNLSYLNEFRARFPEKKDCKELFRKDCVWLSPFYLRAEDLWHCHVGLFLNHTVSSRNLVQVNADIVKTKFPGGHHEVLNPKVRINVYLNYDISGQPPLALTGASAVETLMNNFDNLHGLEKSILQEIFSDEYLEVMNAR